MYANYKTLLNASSILAQSSALQFNWLQTANPRPTIPAVSAVLTSAELKQRERENLTIALTQARGKVFGPSGAAALLGMKPTTVISRIKARRFGTEQTLRNAAVVCYHLLP